MNLTQIETAIKPQFVWDNKPGRRLQTSYGIEGTPEIGLIVFIGIAYNYGLDKKEIIEYLEIKNDEFIKKLKKFENYMQEACERSCAGTLQEKRDIVSKTYIKTKMVHNFIRLNFQSKERFQLIKMGF